MALAAHGDTGWHAHTFPLSVDGVEIVASPVLLADRRARRKSGWLPRAALTIGTAASLAANIATVDTGAISRIIAGWPAVALLIAVKLLSSVLEHRTPDDPACAHLGNSGLPAGPEADSESSPRRGIAHDPPSVPGRVVWLVNGRTVPVDAAALEHAARAARNELHRDGRPLTRDALAARLCTAGYPSATHVLRRS